MAQSAAILAVCALPPALRNGFAPVSMAVWLFPAGCRFNQDTSAAGVFGSSLAVSPGAPAGLACWVRWAWTGGGRRWSSAWIGRRVACDEGAVKRWPAVSAAWSVRGTSLPHGYASMLVGCAGIACELVLRRVVVLASTLRGGKCAGLAATSLSDAGLGGLPARAESGSAEKICRLRGYKLERPGLGGRCESSSSGIMVAEKIPAGAASTAS